MSEPLCPLLKKPCIEHGCKFYIHVTGLHPQTGQPVDHWDCAVAWLPVMLTENARMTRNVSASVDSMRNEVVQRQDELNTAVKLGVNREKAPAVTLEQYPTDAPAIGMRDSPT